MSDRPYESTGDAMPAAEPPIIPPQPEEKPNDKESGNAPDQQ
jgi:hypothetical protein